MITPLPPNTPVCLNRPRGARFVLVEAIGQGGFGITYRATDTLFGNRTVVVKELACEGMCWRNPQTLELEPVGTRGGPLGATQGQVHPGGGDAPEAPELACRAGRSGSWEERGTAYYAMQEVEGARTLWQVHPDPPGWRAAQRLAEELLSALDDIHGAGLCCTSTSSRTTC
jgi:serine/threonine protein kinase